MALKKIKIAVCAALCLTVAASALSACAPTARKTKITVGIWHGSSAEEKELYEECKASFEEKFPQYEIVYSSYVYAADTVVAKFASGQLPTVFEADVSLVKSALENGYIKDVAPYMRTYGWLDKADGYFLSQITAEGAVCGVPAEQYSAGMVLNLPLLHRAGVIERDIQGNYILYGENGEAAYPDTYSEIEEAARKIMQACPQGTSAMLLPSGDGLCGKIYADIIYNFGSGNLEYFDGGKWKLSLSGDEVGDAMRWVKQMSQERYIADGESYAVDAWASKMAAGETAIAFCQSDRLTAALSAEPSLTGNIAFVPMPTAEGVQSCSVWNGKVYAVSGSASDKQIEGAFEFLRFTGYGADTDVQSLSAAERRIEMQYSKNISVFPVIPVWAESEYVQKTQQIYGKYKNINEEYFKEFFNGFNGRKREGEPYARENLHTVLDGLFGKMLFESTTVNIVTLLAESEAEFNAKYLDKII